MGSLGITNPATLTIRMVGVNVIAIRRLATMSVNLNLQSPVMSDIALNENLKLKNLMLLG